MKLLLGVLLGVALTEPTWAQTRSPGPWRVENKLVWVRKVEDWGENMYYDLLNPGGRQLPAETQDNAERWFPNNKEEQSYWALRLQLGDTTDQPAITTKRTYAYLASFNPNEARLAASKPAATGTVVRMQRQVLPVAWDVDPATVTLLRNCGNPLLAPQAGNDIRFAATGATLRMDRAARRLLLAPTEATVILRAYRGKRQLFIHTFEVADAPPPIIKVFCHRPGDGEHEYPPYKLRVTLTLRAIPHPDFAAIMPEDARYRVAQFQATLWRNGQQIQANMVHGPQADLSAWYNTSQPNDSLQVEVLQTQRMNFQGAIESTAVQRTFRMPYREE